MPICPGQKEQNTLTKEWNSSKLGTHKIFADVDYNNNIKESNEDNNAMMKSVEVVENES